ncbi:MAG: nucleotidyl transferase AbiEii/AbiGii toxin family protein [Candidatus Schekmanbacteria bacterium]|nr:nucleotidyl transferase AbiEii/AbiGii toxin family protein [Candidatus Schekmanbacteria bacterium]
MIPARNLSRLAHRLTSRNRTYSEQTLEKDYCLSWLLAGISQSPLKEKLVFKGGTALKKCYFAGYRFSEDLDFTLLTPHTLPEILSLLEGVYRMVREMSGIRLATGRSEPETRQNSYTLFVSYVGPLQATQSKREIKVDITKEEMLLYPITERSILQEYPEYMDIPRDVLIPTYSLEEITVEKLLSLLDKARNEPRDLYDLWYLLQHAPIAIDFLRPGFEKKCQYKGLQEERLENALQKKSASFRVLWEKRLQTQILDLPPLAEVLRQVNRRLREAGYF